MVTIKQQKAFQKVVENGGNVSRAMIEAGYSPATAKTPQKLTTTDAWKELTDKFLNDKELARKHNEQLNSSKLTKLYFDIDDDDETIKKVCKELGVKLLYIKINKTKDGKTANVKAPDFFFRDLALDKAYKIKGRYSGDDKEIGKTLIINITPESNKRYAIDTSPSEDSSRPPQI